MRWPAAAFTTGMRVGLRGSRTPLGALPSPRGAAPQMHSAPAAPRCPSCSRPGGGRQPRPGSLHGDQGRSTPRTVGHSTATAHLRVTEVRRRGGRAKARSHHWGGTAGFESRPPGSSAGSGHRPMGQSPVSWGSSRAAALGGDCRVQNASAKESYNKTLTCAHAK